MNLMCVYYVCKWFCMILFLNSCFGWVYILLVSLIQIFFTVLWRKRKRLHIQRHARISYQVTLLVYSTKWGTGFKKPLCLDAIYISDAKGLPCSSGCGIWSRCKSPLISIVWLWKKCYRTAFFKNSSSNKN